MKRDNVLILFIILAVSCYFYSCNHKDKCTSECDVAGSKSCSKDGEVLICGDYNADSCLEWGGNTSCGSGMVCQDGECVCTDECESEGAVGCSDDGTYVTICEDIDSDGCLEWGKKTDCKSEQICEKGDCVCKDLCTEGEKSCDESGGVITCGNFDDDICLEWSTPTECGFDMTCSEGGCVCKDTCENQGKKKCINNNLLAICEDANHDGCLEWTFNGSCGSDEICVSGECVSGCTNECDQIGTYCKDATTVVDCGQFDQDSCLDIDPSGGTACQNSQICVAGSCVDKTDFDCSNPQPLGQGIVFRDTTNSVSNIDLGSQNQCTGYSTNGPEDIYVLQVDPGKTLKITATPLTLDFDINIYLFESCDDPVSSCVAGADESSDGEEVLFYTNNDNVTKELFLAVDGFKQDDAGAYKLSVEEVDCSEGVCSDNLYCLFSSCVAKKGGNCEEADPLSPQEQSMNDILLGTGSDLDFSESQNCGSYYSTDGPENYYKIHLNSGQRLLAWIETESYAHLYLTRDCTDPVGSCIASSSGSYSKIDFTADQDGDYILVVDGETQSDTGKAYTIHYVIDPACVTDQDCSETDTCIDYQCLTVEGNSCANPIVIQSGTQPTVITVTDVSQYRDALALSCNNEYDSDRRDLVLKYSLSTGDHVYNLITADDIFKIAVSYSCNFENSCIKTDGSYVGVQDWIFEFQADHDGDYYELIDLSGYVSNFTLKTFVNVECLIDFQCDLFYKCDSQTYSCKYTNPAGNLYKAKNLPMTIPDDDPNGVISTIDVPDNITISNVVAAVKVEHNYIGDLKIILTSPDGTEVTLHNQTGSSDDNILKYYGDQDTADGPGSMQNYTGKNAKGTWKLTVKDLSYGIEGQLIDWSLLISQ